MYMWYIKCNRAIFTAQVVGECDADESVQGLLALTLNFIDLAYELNGRLIVPEKPQPSEDGTCISFCAIFKNLDDFYQYTNRLQSGQI